MCNCNIQFEELLAHPINLHDSEIIEIARLNRLITEVRESNERMRCNCINPYGIKKIIYNPPATIVFWEDGKKTVVKTMEGTVFNPYHGFTAALAKRVYGSSTRVNKIVWNGHQAYRYTLLQLSKVMNGFGGYKNDHEHDQG